MYNRNMEPIKVIDYGDGMVLYADYGENLMRLWLLIKNEKIFEEVTTA